MGRKAFAASVALLFLYVSSPLIFPIAMGAVLATLFLPWLERLERRRFRTSAAAGLLTLVIFLFFVLPSALIIFIGTKAAFQQLQEIRIHQMTQPRGGGGGWVRALFDTPRMHALLERMSELVPVQMDELTTSMQELTRTVAAKLADILANLAAHLPGMLLAIAVIVVSVYFFLVDGRRIVAFFRRNSVYSAQETELLVNALAGTCRSVVLASVVSGAAQATVELMVCLLAGVPNATLISILVFLGSFVPVVGSAPVTFGVALHQLLLDHTGAGVVLLVSAVVVAVLDNFIRPIFLRGTANLHPLLAFVAAFGGLQTLGFAGVFLGPIIAALFVAIIQISLRRRDVEPQAAPKA